MVSRCCKHPISPNCKHLILKLEYKWACALQWHKTAKTWQPIKREEKQPHNLQIPVQVTAMKKDSESQVQIMQADEKTLYFNTIQ